MNVPLWIFRPQKVLELALFNNHYQIPENEGNQNFKLSKLPKLPGSYRNWALKSLKNDFSWTWTFQFATLWPVVRVSLISCRPQEPRKSIAVPYSSCKSDDSCSRKDQSILGYPSRLVQDYIISSYLMLPENCSWWFLQLNDP